MEFWWCLKRQDPQRCTFGVLGLSCETPAKKKKGEGREGGRGRGRGFGFGEAVNPLPSLSPNLKLVWGLGGRGGGGLPLTQTCNKFGVWVSPLPGRGPILLFLSFIFFFFFFFFFCLFWGLSFFLGGKVFSPPPPPPNPNSSAASSKWECLTVQSEALRWACNRVHLFVEPHMMSAPAFLLLQVFQLPFQDFAFPTIVPFRAQLTFLFCFTRIFAVCPQCPH